MIQCTILHIINLNLKAKTKYYTLLHDDIYVKIVLKNNLINRPNHPNRNTNFTDLNK